MPTFQYKAKTRAGELVTGTLAAGDRRLALAELGRLGYFPLAVETAKVEEGERKVTLSFRNRITSRDVLMFTQQLSSLLRSGMSLSQAMMTLERRTQKKPFAEILGKIRTDIEQGASLSEALAKFPKMFSKFHINLDRKSTRLNSSHVKISYA